MGRLGVHSEVVHFIESKKFDMVEFNQELRIKSIEFMIDSCEYHLKRIRNELQERFGESEITIVPKQEEKKAIEIIKTQEPRKDRLPIPLIVDSSGKIKAVTITVTPEKGKAVIIYEFNSFITDVMACVNYLVDLKLRLLDGYNGESSKTIGQYMHYGQNLVKNRGDAHMIIEENYTWIKPLKKVRDGVQHKYIQSELPAYLYPFEKGDKLMVKTEILIPYADPTRRTIVLLPFCEDVLEKLKMFKDSIYEYLQFR